MIKFVADLRLSRLALGGEIHADAEEAFLAQNSLWWMLRGGNVYPWEARPRIEYTSLINIRPSQRNRSIEISDIDLRRLMTTTAQLGTPLMVTRLHKP